MEAMTGAHRTLPFGTRIRVENLDTGRSVTVTINDRGPFVKDRILDVSRKAARELEMLGPGTARVRITVLGGSAPG
jgi:rare lipoprotein A